MKKQELNIKQEVNIKQELSMEETVALFNEIAKSISEGTISIEYGKKQITLKSGCCFDVMIEASQKKGKQKLNIELSWKEGDSVCPCKPVLKISSQEPIVEEPAEETETLEENDEVTGEVSEENADPCATNASLDISEDESNQTDSKY